MMPVTALFAARDALWTRYRELLPRDFAKAGIDVRLVRSCAPGEVDYIIYAPDGPISDFSSYTGLKAVLSLWAGVERVIDNPTLTVPLARMVDADLTRGMVEWVSGHVLRHHLGIDRNIRVQDGRWIPLAAPLARERAVAVLGLGALGSAVSKGLAGIGFQVSGWSRHEHDIAGITCCAGEAGLAQTLARAEIVVLMLPLTAATKNLIDAERIAGMRDGAVLINPGRGALLDDAALIAALDCGKLAHATLDVFRTEPLPANHPFWAHPKVTVTPHIAAITHPEAASRVIAENIRRFESGEALLHLVDRNAGY